LLEINSQPESRAMMQIVENTCENLFADDNKSMTQVFGELIEKPIKNEYLTLVFSPSRLPFRRRWRNNSLSADYVAEYLSTFFPPKENDYISLRRQSEIKSAVSYIANELLENAMKHSENIAEYSITLHLQLEDKEVRLFVNNIVNPVKASTFQLFIQQLINSNPEDFYLRQLERNAEEIDSKNSGLGFLTMINDYSAKLGWEFQIIQEEPQLISVTTMVKLIV
jgi:hypothetical protein